MKNIFRKTVKSVVYTYHKTKLAMVFLAYAIKIALELKKGK